MKLNIQEMLRYRRPAGSDTEARFIKRYIDSVPGVYSDKFGNRIKLHPTSKTIISVHTDTVHREQGMQQIAVNGPIVRLHARETVSNCLGADDTAGVYAALRMIQAGVPATFIFHREEEIGGLGSSWLARSYPDWFRQYDHCIALDRRGTSEIITRQAWARSASDEFATALATALDMGHAPSDKGVFTDSANYVGLVRECTNIAIGYQSEHTVFESLNLAYLEALITRLCSIDFAALPARDWYPDVADAAPSWSYSGRYRSYRTLYGGTRDSYCDSYSMNPALTDEDDDLDALDDRSYACCEYCGDPDILSTVMDMRLCETCADYFRNEEDY